MEDVISLQFVIKSVLESINLVAFVAAYGAALVVLILPAIVLELAVGQLTGRASVQAFYHLSPIFKGIISGIVHITCISNHDTICVVDTFRLSSILDYSSRSTI
ncbi:unnamed protein product [Cylicocyclus nassatus]|uniref:Uncharacterized protein n=1 Tax=Cylicocyclus nassatus TaxID=53992 RepID=A0AA36GHP9_CYLNA|nr:unnamed protein product [Cylicocyclus nassatus]